MKRNLVLFGLVVGMSVQALDWFAMRGTAAPRQVESKGSVSLGEGSFPFPKSR